MSFWSRLTNVFRHEHLDRELDAELQAYVDEAIAHGRDPHEVRRAMGSVLRHREASRDVRLASWLDSLRADVVLGSRRLKKHPVASSAAIVSLAIALGACTSTFRLIDALLLRPLPIANPDRLWVVSFESTGADGTLGTYDSSSYPMFRRMRDGLSAQASLLAVSYADRIDLTYGSTQETEKAWWQFVSGSMFSTFGLRPEIGRLFTADDDVTPGAHPYAVLSHDYWTRRFAQDPSVVGRTFRVGEVSYNIVGVTAGPFTGTETGVQTDVFVPMMMKDPRTLTSDSNFWLRTLVALEPGIQADRVHAEMSAIFQSLKDERAQTMASSPLQLQQLYREQLRLVPAAAGSSNLQRDYRPSLIALALLVGMVLLIACANVANLLTAQAVTRSREMALRVSIGAGRARLMQLVLIEGALLAVAATVLGGVLAWWAAPFVLARISPADTPTRLVLSMDWRVLVFGGLLALAVTGLFGLAPALRASEVKPVAALKGDAPRVRQRLMHGLVAAQAAFCFVVLLAGGLFVATFDRLAGQPLGFSADRVVNVEVTTTRGEAPAIWSGAAERLRAVPGVEAAALVSWPVMSGESSVTQVATNGVTSNTLADVLRISPNWLSTMRVPLMAGRDFRPEDASPTVALVNDAFARQYFGGTSPVGRTFDMPIRGSMTQVEIVGLVGDARSRDRMRRPILPTVYLPFQAVDASGVPQPITRGTFAVRTSASDPLTLAPSLRAVFGQTTALHVTNVRTQTAIDEAPLLHERLLSMLALFFSGVALVLGGIGLYGVLDYAVLQRRREIGIRVALGAQRRDIVGGVMREAAVMIGVGSLAGLLVGLGATRYVETLLYGVRATDVAVLTGPLLAIMAVGFVASLPPVLRALRLRPITSLRE